MHQPDMVNRCASRGEPRGRLDEVRASHSRAHDAPHDLRVRQQTRLQDHLDRHAALVAGRDHGPNVLLHVLAAQVLQVAHRDHHVDLVRAVHHARDGLQRLDRRRRSSQREAHHRAHLDPCALQQVRRSLHVHRVDAHTREAMGLGLLAQLNDIGVPGVRLEQRVVDQGGSPVVGALRLALRLLRQRRSTNRNKCCCSSRSSREAAKKSR
mmetsp:Transcript_13882/g.44468  ORF Transcript_13882/g.44468 Transcript_13882/m.44468 type:complete len:210 (+) Transcript_13882:1275-1904(+)